jgi:SAM-dependent methyltransferase
MTPRCPLCGGEADFHATATDIEYFTTSDEFQFFHCEPCDILFIVPMLADRLDLIYPPNYYSFKDGGTKNIVASIKEWLDSRMFRSLLERIPGGKVDVLDIGGGTGEMLSVIRGLDPRVSATQLVDIDAAAEQKALANGHDFFCGRIEDFHSERKFHLILMLNLIEHVARPDMVLRQIAGMLHANGRVLIKTPNFRALDARLFRHRSWAGYHCPRHFVLFSKRSLERAMEAADLQIDQFSYTQGAPFWTPSILELMRRRGLVSITAERPSFFHPLTPVLQGVMAAFDFARRPFFPLSQMVVIGRPRQRG